MVDTKGWVYKQGRKAGANNNSKEDNPHSCATGESEDWETGWIDGYYDIGHSKTAKKPRKPKDDIPPSTPAI